MQKVEFVLRAYGKGKRKIPGRCGALRQAREPASWIQKMTTTFFVLLQAGYNASQLSACKHNNAKITGGGRVC